MPLVRDNLRVGTIEGLASSPWVFATLPSNFILAALLTQYFALPLSLYGVVASLPAWFNAAQLLILPALGRRARPKTITVAFATVNFALWAAFVPLLPFLPRGTPATAALLVAFFTLAALTWSLTVVGWTAWVQEWVPPPLRGRYFGRRNALIGIATLLFLALSTAILARAPADRLVPYLLIFGFALGLRLAALVWQLSIRTPSRAGAAPAPERWTAQARDLWRGRAFRRLVLFGAATGFTIQLTGPFTPVFLFERLGAEPARVNVLFLLSNLAAAVAIPAWGRLLDAHGARPVLVCALAGWEVVNLFWIAVTPATAWLVPGLYVWNGLMSSGFLLGLFHFLLKLLTRDTRTIGASVYAAGTALAGAVAPVVAGAALGAAAAAGVDPLWVYRAGFALRGAGSLAALALLVGVTEPRSTGLRTVLGALHPLRLALLAHGAVLFGTAQLARRVRRGG